MKVWRGLANCLRTLDCQGKHRWIQLASKRKLREGQHVLQRKCVVCHDLRTILVKPRTPTDWVRLVNRMAIKPMIGEPIHQEEEWTVSAYLIAITPDIQVSVREQRQEQMRVDEAKEAAQTATIAMEAEAATEYTRRRLMMKRRLRHSLRINARNAILLQMLKTIHLALRKRQQRS